MAKKNEQYVAWAVLLVVVGYFLTQSAIVPPPPPPPPATSFADDFSSPILGQGWTYVNPAADSQYALSSGYLVLTAAPNRSHDCWNANGSCVRVIRPAFANGNYEAKFDGENITSKYQYYGLYLEQDAANYIRYDYHTGGVYISMSAYKIVNNTGSSMFSTRYMQKPQVYMRIFKNGSNLAFKYSVDGVAWSQAGSVNLANFTVNKAGVMVGNSFLNRTTVANVDYFSMNSTATS